MMVQRQVAGITLTPITEPDFPVVCELAASIWRQHYAGIVSAAQVDSMLSGRFSDAALRGYLHAADRWLEVLRQSGTPVVETRSIPVRPKA
jgi:diamine N-acetyltransferase